MVVKVSKPEINIREKISELDKPSGTAGQALLRSETQYQQSDLLGATLNNVIFNGDMQVAQRGTSFSTGGSPQFTLDRWYSYPNNATGDVVSQQTDSPDGFNYNLRITSTNAYTGGNYSMLRYKMEDRDTVKLNHSSGFTLQFWVKADNPGIYTVALLNHVTSGTQRQISKTYIIESSGAWEHKVITWPRDDTIPFGVGLGYLSIDWHYGKNTGYSSGTLNDKAWADNVSANRVSNNQTNAHDASGKNWALAGVQLVPGRYPTGLPFSHRSYGEELALCQRYFYLKGSGTGFGSAESGAGAYTRMYALPERHPVEMRATPTISLIPGGSTYFASGGGVTVGTPTGDIGTVQNSVHTLYSINSSTTGVNRLSIGNGFSFTRGMSYVVTSNFIQVDAEI